MGLRQPVAPSERLSSYIRRNPNLPLIVASLLVELFVSRLRTSYLITEACVLDLCHVGELRDL